MNRLCSKPQLALVAWLAFAAPAFASELHARVRDGRGETHEFALEREIGHGYWSAAYTGHEVTTGQPAVIKLFKTDRASEGRHDEFDKESAILWTVEAHHGTLVRSYGVGETTDDSKRRAFAMEPARGEELEKSIRREPGKAVRITRRILSQLSELHAAGWAHNDIHGANVYIFNNETPTTKVLDVGNATPLSPKGIDNDIRASAQLLGNMLAGLPDHFPNETQLQGALSVAARYQADIPGRGVRTLRDVMLDALNDRYRSAEEFNQALAPFDQIR